jgi:hypothetical protein
LIVVRLLISQVVIHAQCLSSANPVGGTENLLVLEKNSLRIISFYKHGEVKQYFEKDHHSGFDLIRKAYYNNLTSIIGYGFSSRLTIETELGYYINKSQIYNTQPAYTLSGKGFSNLIAFIKYNLYTNYMSRMFYSMAIGFKIPFTRNPQLVNNVELPIEVQPTVGSYGFVFYSSFVKENSERGLRFFITNRAEVNMPNRNEYQLGTSFFNSFFMSKHLMFPWLKDDWTTIIQLRNEIRLRDKKAGYKKESTGGFLFILVPQINYVIKEKWFLSAMIDFPVYQYFHGTQLGAGTGFTFSLARTFNPSYKNPE